MGCVHMKDRPLMFELIDELMTLRSSIDATHDAGLCGNPGDIGGPVTWIGSGRVAVQFEFPAITKFGGGFEKSTARFGCSISSAMLLFSSGVPDGSDAFEDVFSVGVVVGAFGGLPLLGLTASSTPSLR